MIDTKELRRVAVDCFWPTSPVPIGEILDRLEAAEKLNTEWLKANAPGGWIDDLRIELDEIRYGVAVAHDTIKALRAKIERMEKQEPVAKVRIHKAGGNAGLAWSVAPLNDFDSLPLMRDGDRLYALPGAQAQNVPKAVAYLDLGTGGYMDIGTDLPDEALAALPKGRHMLGVIGTYGVDGYVPAQPAPSMPDVDSLAQFIREVDGSHQLGAGVLAERIAEWLKAAPEAKP